MNDLLLGFMTATWTFTVLAFGYVIWRYVYGPWKVVRRDQQTIKELVDAQNAKLAEAVAMIHMRSAEFLGDEELAFRESRLRARSNQRIQH